MVSYPFVMQNITEQAAELDIQGQENFTPQQEKEDLLQKALYRLNKQIWKDRIYSENYFIEKKMYRQEMRKNGTSLGPQGPGSVTKRNGAASREESKGSHIHSQFESEAVRENESKPAYSNSYSNKGQIENPPQFVAQDPVTARAGYKPQTNEIPKYSSVPVATNHYDNFRFPTFRYPMDPSLINNNFHLRQEAYMHTGYLCPRILAQPELHSAPTRIRRAAFHMAIALHIRDSKVMSLQQEVAEKRSNANKTISS